MVYLDILSYHTPGTGDYIDRLCVIVCVVVLVNSKLILNLLNLIL